MIYTITTNPAIDYILRFDKFEDGGTIRANDDEKYPGGKGIMASKILKNLGEKSINLGFVGGFIGEYIANSIKDLGLLENFVRIKENSRINVKLKYDKETEVNAKGPAISKEEVRKFFDSLADVKEDDIIVISGSLPYSLDSDFYKKLIEETKANLQEVEELAKAVTRTFNTDALGRPVISKADSDVKLVLDNDKLSFVAQGSELAYFGKDKACISALQILQSLNLGKYTFEVQADGGFSIKWID